MLERFDRNRHRFLADGRWLAGVKRQVRLSGCTVAQRVFLYQSKETGRFVVAVRGDDRPGPPRFFMPIESMIWHPDYAPPDRPSAGVMTIALMPAARTIKRAQQIAAEELWLGREAQREQREAKEEYARKCEKMGDHALAQNVRAGISPFAAPSSFGPNEHSPVSTEMMEQMAEMVRRAAYESARQKTGWRPATTTVPGV